MKIAIAASVAALLIASALSTVAQAQTVLNTSLPNANGSPGLGTTTTTTNANGTTTTTTGPAGDGNRYYQAPVANTWQQQGVGSGGTVGITNTYTNDGNGAAYLSTVNDGSKGDLAYVFSSPVLLSDLSSMSFDFYRDSTSTVNANLAPTMRLMMTVDGVFAGNLISEYIYQNNPQTPPPVDTWVTLASTLNSGVFWTSNGLLGPTFAGEGGVKTLQSWIDDNRGKTLAVTGVNFGVGSGWGDNTFKGAVDHVQFAFNNGPSGNFDFAVAGGTVPEPATWGMMLLGFFGIGSSIRAARRRQQLAA